MSGASGGEERIQALRDAVFALRPAMTRALQDLVRISSQTGDEGGAQDYVASLMRDMGLAVDVWEPDADTLARYSEFVTIGTGFAGRPNVVGVQKGTGGGRSLILNGHIDTVDVGDEAAWRVPALGGDIVDDRLYGRGACDMKGGLIANMFALAAVNAAGIELGGDVILESTISEEDGGAGALAAILRGYVADGALISEPTNLAVIVAHGGSMMFRLHVPGLSAHACVRDEGVSAIEKFAYLHQGLLAFEARHNEGIDHPLYKSMGNKAPLNVGTVVAGSWPSSVPEWLTAEGRAGMVPGENHVEFKRQFEAHLDALAEADPWLRDHAPRVEWLEGSFLPSDVSQDSALVQSLAAAIESVKGAPASLSAVTYGADMRHFILEGGVPCVMFGAGDVRDAHAPNESIALEELYEAVQITAAFVSDWCAPQHQ